MELKYDPVKDRKPLRHLVRLMILDRPRDVIVSGMSMRTECSLLYGISIDHHEFASELDQMSREGLVEHYAYHGGDTQYRILQERRKT